MGCVPRVSWHTLWETLKLCIEELLAREKAKVGTKDEKGRKINPSGIYIAVSQRSMQAIDWMWLADKNFRFHHQREAREGSERDPPEAFPEDGGSEFVYYCWPGDPAEDMVPKYSTSIEGATAILLHPDGEKVLLVWERGAWSTSGGAVDGGECKFDALNREVGEELNVKLDKEWGMYYAGGYQQSRARDNVTNDNFSAFIVKLASAEFTPDKKEIMEADFFEWRPILQAWRDKGCPSDKKQVPIDVAKAPVTNKKGEIDEKSERNLVHLNVLHWLDMYEKDKVLKCKIKAETKMPVDEKGVGAYKIQWAVSYTHLTLPTICSV